MDILGIGPLEFVAILIIALIVLGPKDMVKAGRTIGRTLRIIVSSDTWRVVQQASREIRNLPNRMMREAGVEDLQKQLPDQSAIREQLGLDNLSQDLNKDLNNDLSSWTTPPPTIAPPGSGQKPAESEPEPVVDAGAWAEPPETEVPADLEAEEPKAESTASPGDIQSPQAHPEQSHEPE